MMTIAEFKELKGIPTLNFYKSKTSSRLVAGFEDILVVTTEDFDTSGEMYVYDNPKGALGSDYILSNVKQAEAVFSI